MWDQLRLSPRLCLSPVPLMSLCTASCPWVFLAFLFTAGVGWGLVLGSSSVRPGPPRARDPPTVLPSSDTPSLAHRGGWLTCEDGHTVEAAIQLAEQDGQEAVCGQHTGISRALVIHHHVLWLHSLHLGTVR